MSTFPFEASYDELFMDPDRYVDAVFSCLESEFLIMPRGEGFVEYSAFERGYESLKAATSGFSQLNLPALLTVALAMPVSVVVLRTVLGFTPSEWAYLATRKTGVGVTQNFARSLDRRIRMSPEMPLQAGEVTRARLTALLETARLMLSDGAPRVEAGQSHRLDKADTRLGLDGVRNLAGIGVPYAMLLYERFLGRPFAGHRDSVSELIGDSLESAIEDVLSRAGTSYRKTKRAERIEGFDQAPDFMVPSEYSPQVIIEAKITEDDGTARDKVTRIQHLGQLSLEGRSSGKPRYEVVACIGGRGFGVRREDMRKMILATRGKVFTPKTLDRLVACTRLENYRTR